MEDRRTRFRQQIARLEGAMSPKAAIEAGFYVPRPTTGERLLRQIELKPEAIRFVVGPIGSGKSTELLWLEAALNEAPDLWAKYVDVSGLDVLEEGDLVVAATEEIAAREINPLDYRPYDKLESDTLAEVLRDFIGREGAAPVLLFDSLDRADDERFLSVVKRDAVALRDAGFGVVLTAPVKTLWFHSEVMRSHADSWDTLPYEDPARSDAARDFLARILELRSDDAILPTEYRLVLVERSGGVLRDLLELARNAVEEAYVNGHDVVTAADVVASVTRFARSLSLGLDSNAIDLLVEVGNSGRLDDLNQLALALLENRQLLEHDDPATGPYYEVHPALRAALERWAKAS